MTRTGWLSALLFLGASTVSISAAQAALPRFPQPYGDQIGRAHV